MFKTLSQNVCPPNVHPSFCNKRTNASTLNFKYLAKVKLEPLRQVLKYSKFYFTSDENTKFLVLKETL